MLAYTLLSAVMEGWVCEESNSRLFSGDEMFRKEMMERGGGEGNLGI